jgi:hypothetical protein
MPTMPPMPLYRERLFFGFDVDVETRDGYEEMAIIGKGGSSSAFARHHVDPIQSKEGRDIIWSRHIADRKTEL